MFFNGFDVVILQMKKNLIFFILIYFQEKSYFKKYSVPKF
jgi:hypothetical protein